MLVEGVLEKSEVFIYDVCQQGYFGMEWSRYLRRRLPLHGVLPGLNHRIALRRDENEMYLPLKCSTSIFSIVAPKSTSEEGSEMALILRGVLVVVMIADMIVNCFESCIFEKLKCYG